MSLIDTDNFYCSSIVNTVLVRDLHVHVFHKQNFLTFIAQFLQRLICSKFKCKICEIPVCTSVDIHQEMYILQHALLT